MVRVAYCNSEYGGVDYLYIKKQFCGDVIGKKNFYTISSSQWKYNDYIMKGKRVVTLLAVSTRSNYNNSYL